MTARRGRTKRGRPGPGDCVFLNYAEDADSAVMRILSTEAAAQHWTLTSLAKSMEVEHPTGLANAILGSKRPRQRTVVKFCSALGFREHVGRALLRSLTSQDIDHLEEAILFEVYSRSAVFTDYSAVLNSIKAHLAALSAEKRNEGLAVFAIAEAGLDDPVRFDWPKAKERSRHVQELVLQRVLGSSPLARLLASFEDLKFFDSKIAPYLNKAERRKERADEAAAALFWLKEAIPLSLDERDTINEIVGKYVSNRDITNISGQDAFCLMEVSQAFHRARRTVAGWKSPAKSRSLTTKGT